MKIFAVLLLLSSLVFAQKLNLQDYTETAMPLFFEDSLRFNFSEVADFKASLGSYGNGTNTSDLFDGQLSLVERPR